MRAYVLVDLGFGDSGKGLLTDYLVRHAGAGLVVRYNGGAQAGHNVVAPDGRHHTFAQFGAGTFTPGVRTFLSRHVVIHPTALLREAEALRQNGVADALDRLRLSERALVITPFHQAAGRLRELARRAARHGSCGVGVGETVRDAIEHPADAVRAADLRDGPLLLAKLARARDRLWAAVESSAAKRPAAVRSELEIFEREETAALWHHEAQRLLRHVAPDDLLRHWMREARTTVFEGAQGVLLDEERGFHPYTTWSRCTPENALALLAEAAPEAEVKRFGILRSHAVRHGPGPLPTEAAELRGAIAEHNSHGDWQGAVRYGWFDAVLARYALDCCGGLDGLAMTHLDLASRLGAWRTVNEYRGWSNAVGQAGRPGSMLSHLPVPPSTTLALQEELGQALSRVQPVAADCAPSTAAIRERCAELLGHSVLFTTSGPRALDVQSHAAD